MTDIGQILTTSSALAAARQILTDNHYAIAANPDRLTAVCKLSVLAEDQFGVVAVCAYDSWTEAKDSWPKAQGALVEILSTRLGRADPKAWEGYLVLLVLGTLTPEEQIEATKIRYDTTRVRKLVSIGKELKYSADVERALLPLLTLDAPSIGDSVESLLESLPTIARLTGENAGAMKAVVEAFRSHDTLMDKLHEYLGRTRT